MGLLSGVWNKPEIILKHTVANHCYEVIRSSAKFHLNIDGVEYDFGYGNLSADTPDGLHVEFKVEWSDFSLFVNGVQEYHIKK